MKRHYFAVALVSFCLPSLEAQDTSSTSPKSKPKAEKVEPAPLVTKHYQVSSGFRREISAFQKVNVNPSGPFDPFAAPDLNSTPVPARQTVQESLEKQGVVFTDGASATFEESSLRLTHTNTMLRIQQVEDLLESIREQSEKLIYIYMEFIEVDHDEFSDWLFENVMDADGTPLRNEVQKWIKEGRAEIVESATVAARSGQRAKVESIDEYIYPTEYDPPEIPNEVTLKNGATAPVSAATPTAFETRNLGVTLEVDPVLGTDSKIIDINLAPELVELEGVSQWHHRTEDPRFMAHMPTFYTQRITTQLTAYDGRYAFLGTTRPLKAAKPDRKNPIVLQFVRGDVGALSDWSEIEKE